MELHSNGRLLDLPVNIRLGWKSVEIANTLAFYNAAIITAVKCFVIPAPGVGTSEYFYGIKLWIFVISL
jgi:hypothetical protein